ncbi:DNA replication ATP-dependent helicase/nuclease dna2 [Golovinomyces cichoracearum]|uniref:DNA replication ATP-dependent helicase/nuclease n=1 Tax=Golovinomyces cichoracearum TaxID=62708 RepID=A0A420IDD9_9PEZI|nr:DNA replication ATP-dependent helicase/nuclease dna2 [Golovinomyces cichoracearum]
MPLQRSFSEQNHSTKLKQKWSRNRNIQRKKSTDLHSNLLREKPPLPVSTASKNKLSNFQFSGRVQTELKTKICPLLNDEKENEDTRENLHIIRDHRVQKEEREVHPTPPDKTSNKSPSTPASKLTLPDLICMGDVRRVKQDISPEEKLEWDQNKGEHQNFALDFDAVRAVGKRAQSSSPLVSSPIQAPIQFDPGSELWGRYSHSDLQLPTCQGLSIPSLAHIMNKSSPKNVQEGVPLRSVSVFRRANSCGNHFPKRMKYSDIRNDDSIDPPFIDSSKVSTLIKQIKDGLAQHKKSDMIQETTLKTNQSDFIEIPVNQENFSRIKNGPSESEFLPDYQSKVSPSVHEHDAPDCLSSNSLNTDYGDFDEDELDPSLLKTSKSLSKEYISNSKCKSVSTGSSASPLNLKQQKSEMYPVQKNGMNPQQSHMASNEELIGEFDDSEVEILSADLEFVVSQYDTRSINEPKVLPPRDVDVKQLKDKLNIESEDEFDDGGLDDDDFKAAEASTLQTFNGLTTPQEKTRAIQRYLVVDIMSSLYEDSGGRKKIEKILSLQIEHTKYLRSIHLRGTWVETPVTVNAFVHIIGLFNSDGQCIVDDDENLLILHPDHLISSTVVADSFSCIRRAVLQDRVKATSQPNVSLIYGTLLHEIFQAALISNRWDSEWLEALTEDVVKKHVEDLYTIKLQTSEAVRDLKNKIAHLQSWAALFVCSNPKPGAILNTPNGETVSMCIEKLLEIEEHIWSPMYGLKGNIDATVQVIVKEKKGQRRLIVPLELKTGKNQSISHRAQTALYNLLLSDRYDIDIAHGILYYMETSETQQIPTIRHELRHMIMQRNELACFVRERSSQLPPMLKERHKCNGCYANVPCFTYHKLADDGTGETSGLKSKFDQLVKHLTRQHKEFFLKWDDLMTKEEGENMKFRRELWTMLSSEREKLGRCFSNVIIEPGSFQENNGNKKISRYKYTFIKKDYPSDFSFLDSQINVGEPIVISDEKGHFALANGFAIQASKHKITVEVDRRLCNNRVRQAGFNEVDNQVFLSTTEVAQSGKDSIKKNSKRVSQSVLYRLDKDEFSNGMATVRNNLIQIMADGPFGSRQIRRLVVDLEEPRFKTQVSSYKLKDYEKINIDQKRAIEKVMCAEDYALILGMPGTGKTTTIVYVIQALVSLGKSVLLTSYTHTAVDNILLKLRDKNIPILRLGQLSKICPEVTEFVTLAAEPKDSFEKIRNDWYGTPIVATTCLGINHSIFNERTFDFCIVDEASQITLPVCLGPIRLARTFILVGDHNQLPPLVQNEEARKGGLDISLFKRLSENHPTSVVYLEHQYRMCEDIMTLSNTLIYNGRLKCGNQEIARRKIFIPSLDNLQHHHFPPLTSSGTDKVRCLGTNGNKCWLRDLIIPEAKVLFVNTDSLVPLSREVAKGNRIVNPTEANICTKLVQSLLSVGVPASSIGVMTHYRSQLELLKFYLRAHKQVEIDTADRFQGRDKDVIILSLVRCNDARSIGELLKDWRRINVAFTRAKTKLLVIGSRETLKGDNANTGNEEMVARFVKLMEKNSLIYHLPLGALEDHFFEDVNTQATACTMDMSSSRLETLKSPGSSYDYLDTMINSNEKKAKLKHVRKCYENQVITSLKNCRQPRKRLIGTRPIKIPWEGILSDIIHESLG